MWRGAGWGGLPTVSGLCSAYYPGAWHCRNAAGCYAVCRHLILAPSPAMPAQVAPLAPSDPVMLAAARELATRAAAEQGRQQASFGTLGGVG